MHRITHLYQKNRTVIIFAILLFILAALLRMTDLGTFLTADEKNWIGRSYEFIKAFKDWRFNNMLQTTHPGVTTLWLSGLAVTAKMFTSHIPFSFDNLIHFVKASQMSIALANSVMVPVIYLLLTKLFNRHKSIALVASLLIALNPFIVGYSRVTHVDALLGGFLFAAAVATIIYARTGFSRRWLLVSSAFAGLALLTKAPAVFIFPYFALVILAYEGRHLVNKERLISRARDITTWLLIIGLMIVIIWPAVLWVPNPQGNVLLLKRDIGRAAITPHHMAQDYRLDIDFYFYTLLTRTTPLVQLFSLIAVIGLIISTLRRKTIPDNKTTWLLAAYVFFFLVMMVLGAKKGDRYILPVYFAIDTLAAVGIWYLSRLTSLISNADSKRHFTTLSFVVILLLGAVTYSYHPYAIAYSNPLFPDNLSQELGWGEGLEQVGQWLNQNDPDAVVASWYPEELGAFTTAHVAHINAHAQGKVKYVVLYRNMFGRAPDHYANNFIDEYYKKRLPAHIVKIKDKEYAWIYAKKVYDRIVGEITPSTTVSQVINADHNNIIGLEIMAATYSGQAKRGQLIVQLINRDTDKLAKKWAYPISEIKDKGWTRLMLENKILNAGQYRISLSTRNIGEQAPTMRYNNKDNYRASSMNINGEEKPGDLAIRFLYRVNGETVTEEDEKKLDHVK